MPRAVSGSARSRGGPDRTFPRTARLRSAGQFRLVFAESVKKTDAFFIVRARPNLAGEARLGLAVSKRSVRRSVDRSRIKRIIRESFRSARAQVRAMDYVVIARHAAVAQPNQALFDALRSHWRRFADHDG
ncbi:ribonuclease P protein component [Thiococcus pfennigii]|uniref:ribonuclease P protein component n=1 Tax=Thiococcus pfennigii TaxID=1057 RepID=UPI003B847B4C|nr:ribonuclease P protein component [Thiococcus pfennigii]MBK1733002.1 ribonuclease P protein component [Thiococcus pfennigii]